MSKKAKFWLTILFIFLITTGMILHPAVLIVLLAFYGEYSGKKKAKRKFQKEIKKIKLDNPHIYFREIPNSYGVGVSGLLLDFNLDQNDLIAGIIDLCAKKYITIEENENTFEIIYLNKDMNNLLDNEKYILNWILSNNEQQLKNFDYNEWRSLVKQDALSLNLIKQRESDYNTSTTIADSITKKEKIIMFLIFISCFIGIGIFAFLSFSNNEGVLIQDLFTNIGYIFYGLITLMNSLIVSGIISGIISIILWLIILMIHSFTSSKEYGYNSELINTPILTDLGISEVQELYSLGNFIKDFGKFADKHISEIIIWEQYFSYAQLFDLTNYLLNTNYHQLINNQCFKIKNTNKIKKVIIKTR